MPVSDLLREFMNHRNHLVAAVLTAVALTAGLAQAQGPNDLQQPAARPAVLAVPGAPVVRRAFTMGFVNMEKLIQEHPDRSQLFDKFRRELESKIETLRAQAKEASTIRDSLELEVEGSPQYLASLKRIRTIEEKLKLEQKVIKIEFDLKMVSAMKNIYEQCKMVVADVAKARGLSAIAMVSQSEVSGRTRSEVVGDILTRPFVYYDVSLDITADVLQKISK